MSHLAACGAPEPPGVTPADGGVNVAVFSAHAEAVELCLFDRDGEREVERVALPGRTGDVRHGFVRNVAPGTRYGLRARGRFDPARGHRFDASKLLVDPYARALDRPFTLHPSMFSLHADGTRNRADSAPHVPKAIVAAPPSGAATALGIPWARTVVYELHVRGFTMRHPDVPPAVRGTIAGLAAPAAVAHLRALGVTTVELMPIAAKLDERHLPPLGLTNYWGYNPVTMLAVDPRLAPGGVDELARTVAALHDAGLEVVLDVVFNHTAEGDEFGPTVCYRGLDNASWYRLRQDDPSRYADDAGCGNVLACDRPHVVRLVLDALRHYVVAANVDGFRFDLGTTLARRETGFDADAPLLAAIAQDPLLATRKVIVEPWDLGPGGYRLGAFPAAWGEWNDRYRDALRRFFRGEPGVCGDMATRLAGSADVFAARSRPLSRSVNFVTAHDGFTLADLVSYARKHNEANGEENRDGADGNDSWNHGLEGASDDPAIVATRAQDVRSLLAALLFSRGTPMLSMGDELGRTQDGNNNAYAQDGPLAWVDWEGADRERAAFAARLVALRAAHPALRDDMPLTGAPRDASGIPDVEWRRADGEPMTASDWHDPDGRTLVAVLYVAADEAQPADRVVVVVHAHASPLDVRLPDPRAGHRWVRAADSASPALREAEASERLVNVAARSVVLFVEAQGGTRARAATGVEPAVLARLAAAAGIATEWWDIGGKRHATSPDTQRALLCALGLSVATTSDARARLVEIAATQTRGLPVADVVAAERPGEISIAAPASRQAAIVLTREDGWSERIVVDAATAPRVALACADGRTSERIVVAIPALPPGVHRLQMEEAPGSACTLVAAPGRCHVPQLLREGGRAFGVAAHLYSLRRPGDLGIGDFAALRDLALTSAARGAALVGLNPLHALFPADRDRASPYHPSDRRFLDPIYVDVERVPDFAASPEARATLAQHNTELAALRASRNVDYPRVWAIKRDVLAACHRTFGARGPEDPLRRDFERFVVSGGPALADFALFDAISAQHARKPWHEWPEGLRSPQGHDAHAFASRNSDALAFALYLQWIADLGLGDVADAARRAGLAIGLYRDLAIGAAPDGAEVWADARAFARGASVGAPPDPFAPDGQVWDLPAMNPLTLAEGGYARFRALVRANLRHAGALRIDHVMGLARLFLVPEGGRAADGAYIAYPLDDLLGALALESERAGAMIVGEDLGTVPEGLRDRLDAAGVFSSVVVWLEREGAEFRAPSRWRRNGVASVSTHDLPTIAGWWSGYDLDERERFMHLPPAEAGEARARRAEDRRRLTHWLRDQGALEEEAAEPPDPESIAPAIHRLLADSPAAMVLVQADDLAGEADALNLPGTDRERPNWRRRLAVDAAALWSTPTGEAAAADLALRAAEAPDATG